MATEKTDETEVPRPEPKLGGRKHGKVRDPRRKRSEALALTDPRPSAHRDLLAVRQRVLRKGGDMSGLNAEDTSTLADAHYRYTKSPSVVNENMGYGEQVEEIFWCKEGGALVMKRRVSRLTRTGRQVLPAHASPTEKSVPRDGANQSGGTKPKAK